MTQNGVFRWMRFVAVMVTLAAPLTATSAGAIARLTSTSMTCASIGAAIANEGEVLLHWTSPRTGNPLYGRAVANRRYCLANQITKKTSVPASDTKNCRINYCVERRVFQLSDDH